MYVYLYMLGKIVNQSTTSYPHTLTLTLTLTLTVEKKQNQINPTPTSLVLELPIPFLQALSLHSFAATFSPIMAAVSIAENLEFLEDF